MGLALSLVLVGTTCLSAQDRNEQPVKQEVSVQRHTMLERFAPDMAPSAQERVEKKKEHLAVIALKQSVLDTMDMPERKRQKLLEDLRKNPFSNRLQQAFADVKFEEEDGIDH
tara:strand:- start:2493 stop:2831 length:339 start_codon:yes stop_codon:yes gene_type:complete